MWSSHLQVLDAQTTKTTLSANSHALNVGEVIQLWQKDEAFCRFFSSTITQSEFNAFFWETPPITAKSLGRPFEFVLVSAPSLVSLRPDSAVFSEHFLSSSSDQVVTFSNLGGDATLVVPAPKGEASLYPHLSQFLRHAPVEQTNALWNSVGLALGDRISDIPVWVSTAGLGVSWLHIRLDSRPKYYRYEPYKNRAV